MSETLVDYIYQGFAHSHYRINIGYHVCKGFFDNIDKVANFSHIF